jgi:hypothetical protein
MSSADNTSQPGQSLSSDAFGLDQARQVLGDAPLTQVEFDGNRLRVVFETQSRVRPDEIVVGREQVDALAQWARANGASDLRIQVPIRSNESAPFPPQASLLRDAGFVPRVFSDRLDDVLRLSLYRCGVKDPALAEHLTDEVGRCLTRVLCDIAPLPHPSRSAITREVDGNIRVSSIAELTADSSDDPTADHRCKHFIRSSPITSLLPLLNIGNELNTRQVRVPERLQGHNRISNFFDVVVAEGVTEWQMQLDDTPVRLHAHGATNRLHPLRSAIAASWATERDRLRNDLTEATGLHPFVDAIEVSGTVPIFGYNQPPTLDTAADPVVKRGIQVNARMVDGRVAVIVVPDQAATQGTRVVEIVNAVATVATELHRCPIAPTAITYLREAEGVYSSTEFADELVHRVHISDTVFADDTIHDSNAGPHRRAALGAVLDTDERTMNPVTDRSLLFQFSLHEHVHAADRTASFLNAAWKETREALVSNLLGPVGQLGGLRLVDDIAYHAQREPSILDSESRVIIEALPTQLQRSIEEAHSQAELAGLYSTRSTAEGVAELGVVGLSGVRNQEVGRQVIDALRDALDASAKPNRIVRVYHDTDSQPSAR